MEQNKKTFQEKEFKAKQKKKSLVESIAKSSADGRLMSLFSGIYSVNDL